MQISDNKSKKQDPWTFKLHKISIWEKYYLIFVEKLKRNIFLVPALSKTNTNLIIIQCLCICAFRFPLCIMVSSLFSYCRMLFNIWNMEGVFFGVIFWLTQAVKILDYWKSEWFHLIFKLAFIGFPMWAYVENGHRKIEFAILAQWMDSIFMIKRFLCSLHLLLEMGKESSEDGLRRQCGVEERIQNLFVLCRVIMKL